MIVIVTVDDRMGVMFNCRRQSKDEEVCKKIVEICGENKLLMNSYSAKIFTGYENKITVSENFLYEAEEGDYCFSEGEGLEAWDHKIEKLIVFKWNRAYPSDVKLDISPMCRKLEKVTEFTGKSHEKITMEVYGRNVK